METGWAAVQLNDFWPPSRRAEHLEAWYRTQFELTAQPHTRLGLYIPRVSSVAGIWLNGIEIGSTGNFEGPLTNSWNHPRLFELPADFLTVGTNTLHVRLKVIETEMGMLHAPQIGGLAELNLRYERAVLLKVTASKILSLVMAIGVAIMAIFYFALKLPSSYLWFIAGSSFWIIFSLELFVVQVPLPYRLWDWLAGFSFYAAVACYFGAVVRMLGLRRPGTERLLWALAAIHVIGVLVLSPVWFSLFNFVYTSIAALLIVYIGLMLFYRGWRRRSVDGGWMMTAGSLIMLFVMYDAFMFTFRITADFAKFPYIPLIATVGGAAIFFRRIIKLNEDHEIMKGNVRTVDAAISSERRRLLREIHDGVGGQLVNTLAILQRGDFKNEDIMDSVKTSLDDLRLIVSSLEPLADRGDILGILATVRERLERRLAQAGITLRWRVEPIPDVPWFDSGHALQLMRILQEAITNVLKHASASNITLSCEAAMQDDSAGILLQIADDGVGVVAGERAGSHGVKNMEERASLLGGTLAVEQRRPGTLVRLWLPLEHNAERIIP